jgi:hypothetical protein
MRPVGHTDYQKLVTRTLDGRVYAGRKSMLRLGLIHWLLLDLLVAAWSGRLQGASLDKVWELDLRTALGSSQSYKVVGLAFSPDAQQVVVRLIDKAVLFQVREPKTVLGRFQSLANHDSFGWSPDSQIIYSGGHIVHLASTKACDLPGTILVPGFIRKTTLVAQVFDGLYPRGGDPRATLRLRFYDADCQEQNSWEVPKGWFIRDVSPDRGLLSAWEITPLVPYGHKELIVSPLTKKVLRSRVVEYGPSGWFADGGSALCGGKICWDVDTAKQIGQAPLSGSVSSGSGVTARSSRVVLDDPHESGIPLASIFTEMAARRWVWDFRTNKEVVSWQLRFITYSTALDGDGFSRDRKPIPCAISPDGEYVVEGGDGKIWLYKIRP